MKSRGFIKIASVGSTIEADQIVNILKDNGIDAYRQGGIMDIYLGNSTVGEDIYVFEKDQKIAQKIMHGFDPIKTNAVERRVKQETRKRIVGWVLLILMVLIVLIPLFF